MTSHDLTVEGLQYEVARLTQRITDLEARLDAMGTEVRTRRLVVVDRNGAERIIADAPDHLSDDSAELTVCDPSGSTNARLSSICADDGGGEYWSEFNLSQEGNSAVAIYAMRQDATIAGRRTNRVAVIDMGCDLDQGHRREHRWHDPQGSS